jgi:carboxypeptidase C (cathepsin A)
VLTRRTLLLALLPSLAVTLAVAAWQASAKDADPRDPDKDKAKEKDKAPRETLTETAHTATIGGDKLSYEASAGTLLLKEEDGKTTASVFYVAYTKSGV